MTNIEWGIWLSNSNRSPFFDYGIFLLKIEITIDNYTFISLTGKLELLKPVHNNGLCFISSDNCFFSTGFSKKYIIIIKTFFFSKMLTKNNKYVHFPFLVQILNKNTNKSSKTPTKIFCPNFLLYI